MPASFSEIVTQHADELCPVVPFNSQTDKMVAIDLSVNNTALQKEVFSDISRFCLFIDTYRQQAGAKYAVGGYDEHRQIYSFSEVFNAATANEEPRRLHLGVDVWGDVFTPVSSPFDGIVHSNGYHTAPGDYGGTIILAHQLSGLIFYTLYGHLSSDSVVRNRIGTFLKGGQVFAETGVPAENGYWPPHLHFQIILDMEGRKGDYPGVCKYVEKRSWLANCPDGDLILGFNRYLRVPG